MYSNIMYKKNTLLLRAKELEDAKKLEERKKMLGKNKTTGMARTLLDTAKIKKSLDTTLIQRGLDYQRNLGKDKTNLTLLEKGLLEGNEYMKLGNRQSKKPIVNDIVEIKDTNNLTTPHDEKFNKILHYAKKYKIPYHAHGVRKTYKQLLEEIHRYEIRNTKELVKQGLDSKYHEHGHYIKVV